MWPTRRSDYVHTWTEQARQTQMILLTDSVRLTEQPAQQSKVLRVALLIRSTPAGHSLDTLVPVMIGVDMAYICEHTSALVMDTACCRALYSYLQKTV
jgi:hypothetical protein